MLMKIAFLNWKIKGFIEIIIKNFFSARCKKCDSKIYILIRKICMWFENSILVQRFYFWLEDFIFDSKFHIWLKIFTVTVRVAYSVISQTKNLYKRWHQAYFVKMMWWLRVSMQWRFWSLNPECIVGTAYFVICEIQNYPN